MLAFLIRREKLHCNFGNTSGTQGKILGRAEGLAAVEVVMASKFRRYFYEVDYVGEKAESSEMIRGTVIVESTDLAKDFPPLEAPILSEAEQREQREAVEAFFFAHLPTGVAKIKAHAINRKDEYDEEFGVISTRTKRIAKLTSMQTFKLTPKQEEVFQLVDNQLLTLSMKWGEWKTLFGPPFQNIEILQRAAPTVFSVIRESLMHEVLLSIRRLFDPKGKHQENASFYWLADNLEAGNQRDEFLKSLTSLGQKTEFLKRWRDKVIAHNDYEHGVNKELLPPVEIEKIDEIVEDMSHLLNIVQINLSTNLSGAFRHYDSVIVNRGADALIAYLKRGLKEHDRALEELRARMKEPPPV